MLKTRIHNIEEAYRALFEDIRFEVQEDVLYLPKRSWSRYAIVAPENYKEAFEKLTEGVITPDNKELIELRYGLHDGVAHTLKSCGESYYLTVEAVRLRIKAAFRKLRHRINLNNALDKLKCLEGGIEVVERGEKD